VPDDRDDRVDVARCNDVRAGCVAMNAPRLRRSVVGSAVLGLLALAAAGGWLALPRESAAPATISTLQREGAVVQTALDVAALAVDVDLVAPESGVTPPTDAATMADPLPAPAPPRVVPVDRDLSVLELLEFYGEDARNGDVVAACEISRGLGECARRDEFRRMAMPPPGSGSTVDDRERHRRFEALRRAWVSRTEQRCQGIGRDDIQQAMDYTARAARAGHIPSLLDLTNAPSAAFIRDPQLIGIYRTEVWSLLQRALATGNAYAAATVMAHIRQPARSALWQVLPEDYRDPWAAEAMYRMMTGIDPPSRPERRAPTAEERAVARRWVDELLGGTLPKHPEQRMLMPIEEADLACADSDQWLDDATR
jgi:hypothetical protein